MEKEQSQNGTLGLDGVTESMGGHNLKNRRSLTVSNAEKRSRILRTEKNSSALALI